MTRPYNKSGRPRKPYTRKKPAVAHRKPELKEKYLGELTKAGNFSAAARALGVTANAVRLYLKRNGINVKRVIFVEGEQ